MKTYARRETPLRADSQIEKDYMSGHFERHFEKVRHLLYKPGLFDFENE